MRKRLATSWMMLMCSRQTFVATNVHPQMTTAASKSTWVTERNRLEFTRIAMITVSGKPGAVQCAPVNGLAGCYVSTIGKPHEYFDLTGSLLAEPNQVLGQLLDLFLAIDLQEPTGLESD